MKNSFGAGPFKIINRTYGNIPAQFQSELDTLFNSIETDVNSSLPQADQASYLKGMSDSTVMTTKGLGVDYANSFNVVIVGYGVGLGADIGDQSFSDLTGGTIDGNQIRGFSLQSAMMGGINMRIVPIPKSAGIDFSRIKIFLDMQSSTLPTFADGFSGKISTFGLHLQYKLWEPAAKNYFNLFSWGGIDLTTGMDNADVDIKFVKQYVVSKDVTLTMPGTPTVTGTFNGTAQAGADISITTIPIELSTSWQILYLISPFMGLGVDINSGTAKSLAKVDGAISVSDNSNTLGNVGATASLDLGEKGEPTATNGRWFAGLQLNMTLLKIYAQLNSGLGESTWGINAGLRLAF